MFIFPYNLTSFRPKWIFLRIQICPNLVIGLVNESGVATEYKMETEHCIQALVTSGCVLRKDFIYLKTCSFLQYKEGRVLYTWSQMIISFSETWFKINVENPFINTKMKDYTDI